MRDALIRKAARTLYFLDACMSPRPMPWEILDSERRAKYLRAATLAADVFLQPQPRATDAEVDTAMNLIGLVGIHHRRSVDAALRTFIDRRNEAEKLAGLSEFANFVAQGPVKETAAGAYAAAAQGGADLRGTSTTIADPGKTPSAWIEHATRAECDELKRILVENLATSHPNPYFNALQRFINARNYPGTAAAAANVLSAQNPDFRCKAETSDGVPGLRCYLRTGHKGAHVTSDGSYGVRIEWRTEPPPSRFEEVLGQVIDRVQAALAGIPEDEKRCKSVLGKTRCVNVAGHKGKHTGAWS